MEVARVIAGGSITVKPLYCNSKHAIESSWPLMEAALSLIKL